MADKRDILIRLLGEETVSRMADRAGDGLDRFGKSLDATENDAKHLDRQIAEVEGSLKTLATAFARTNDAADRVDITKAMRRQQTELRKLTKAKDLLPDFTDEGSKAATGFATSFAAKVGPLLARAPLGGVGAAIGAVIAVPVVSTLGAAIAGAVVGGVGIGGVVGGIALAAKDSRVQSAGKQLSDAVMGDLESSATRFVSPTIRGIQIIEGAWHDVSDTVDDVFAATSRYVEPLARGVAGAVREIAPGFRDAAEAAGPIIDVLRDELPELGATIGDLLSTMADHADEGASAIRLIVMGLELAVDTTAGFVGTLAEVYRALVIAGTAAADFTYSLYGWMPIIGDQIRDNRDRMHELNAGLDKGGAAGAEAGTKIQGGLSAVRGAANGAIPGVRSLAEIMDDFAGQSIDAEQANIRLEQAIDDAAAAAKRGKDKGIDPNTKAGRENRTALLGIASAARDAAAKIYAQTGSQEDASAATERGRKKFLEAARAMGVGKDAAIELANKLFGIPKDTKPKVTVQDAQAKAAIAAIKGGIATIRGKSVTVTVKYETRGRLSSQGEHTIGVGTNTKYDRWGGVHIPMAAGGITQAGIYPASSPPLIRFAEPETGGEAYIPRRGNLARSRKIWEHVGKNWLGMGAGQPVMWGGSSVTNQYSISVNVAAGANLAEAGRQVVEAIKSYERGSGKGWRT